MTKINTRIYPWNLPVLSKWFYDNELQKPLLPMAEKALL